jgi:hypothetical protein
MCMLGPRGRPSGDKFAKNAKDEEIDPKQEASQTHWPLH